MTGSARRAIIVGGGIGGLAAAIALTRIGVDVEVFEQASELREVGAGIGLWPNAMHALDQIGVADRVLPLMVRSAAGLRTNSGRMLVRIETGPFDAACVHRADLHRVLLTTVGAGRVTLDARCIDFTQDAGGVDVRFADGRQARGDLLIGADGLHSVVREKLFGAAPPVFAGYVSWRGVAVFDHSRLQPGETWGAGMRFGHFPISGGHTYWFATCNLPEGSRSPRGEKAQVSELFRGWHTPIPALIEATDDRAFLRNDTYDRPPLRTWSAGRVTLLGDAAHPMTPNLGQGACQALEDAVVLARSLQQSADVESAFRAYESARIARANMIVRRSRQVGAVAQWQHPWAVGLRNEVVRVLGPRAQARQLTPIAGFKC